MFVSLPRINVLSTHFSVQKSIPTGNDKCQFNLWFNTTFIDNKRYNIFMLDIKSNQLTFIVCNGQVNIGSL